MLLSEPPPDAIFLSRDYEDTAKQNMHMHMHMHMHVCTQKERNKYKFSQRHNVVSQKRACNARAWHVVGCKRNTASRDGVPRHGTATQPPSKHHTIAPSAVQFYIYINDTIDRAQRTNERTNDRSNELVTTKPVLQKRQTNERRLEPSQYICLYRYSFIPACSLTVLAMVSLFCYSCIVVE